MEYSLRHVQLRGVVCAVPGSALSVQEAAHEIPAELVGRISNLTGVRQLHKAPRGLTTGDLCYEAAERLLADLGWPRETVDGLVFVTQTPDYIFPSNAYVLHGRLGLSTRCMAFDVTLGCSGYVYGLATASQFVASGACRRLLLMAGDTISQLVSPRDRAVAPIFGDAGSVTALEYDPEAPVSSFVLHSNGEGMDKLIVPSGGFRNRPTPDSYVRLPADDGSERAATDVYMDGFDVYCFTMERVPPLIADILRHHGWTLESVDSLLLHQANNMITRDLIRKLRISRDRVPVNIDRYGNTSSASVPLLLASEYKSIYGDRASVNLLMAAFGVGYSWAAAALTVGHLGSVGVIEVPVSE